ncbi:MAG TPA: ABC transporter substrate-binding protein [Feifaniaceae bacterium]|nr:ABC transporter substrate-binding protein [Feifaniaceae bacterium]
MNMKRKAAALVLAIMLTLSFFAGCANTADVQPAGDTAQPSAQPSAGAVPAATQSVDTLKVGLAAMLNNFDPLYGIGIASIKIFYNIFDTLLTTDKNGNIVGQLAESFEWADDKTLNVRLRPGITFQNGEPCTADDVKFTFDRVLSGYGDGTISLLYETLESVAVLDELTVQFKTKTVDAAFLDRLGSIWGASIVPKDYTEKVGDEVFKTQPIGTGPYQMTSYSPEKIVLTRYDGFWGEKPSARQIEFILYPEASARVTALINGEVDIINDVKADMVQNIESRDGLHVLGTPIQNIHIYVFSTANGPMKSEKFRQALTIGINRQLLVDTLWGEYAEVPQGHQFKSYGDTYVGEYPGIRYDTERARQLVQESGYDGTVIEIEMRQGYYTNGDQAGEAIVDMWKDIGVNAKVVYKDAMPWEETKHIRAWSSASRFDDPLGALWLLFGPGSAPANYMWLDMPEDFKETGRKLTETNDPAERKKLAGDLLRMFDTYCPGTYLYQAEDYYGVRDGIEWDMHYAQNQITPFRADDIRFAG